MQQMRRRQKHWNSTRRLKKKKLSKRARKINGEVSKEEFKALIKQLIASGNKSADKPAQVPKDKDLNAALRRPTQTRGHGRLEGIYAVVPR